MYSRSPNRDELEVGKKLRRTTAASGIRWLEDGWAEVAEPWGGPSRRCRRRPAFLCPHITLRGNGECGTAPK